MLADLALSALCALGIAAGVVLGLRSPMSRVVLRRRSP